MEAHSIELKKHGDNCSPVLVIIPDCDDRPMLSKQLMRRPRVGAGTTGTTNNGLPQTFLDIVRYITIFAFTAGLGISFWKVSPSDWVYYYQHWGLAVGFLAVPLITG